MKTKRKVSRRSLFKGGAAAAVAGTAGATSDAASADELPEDLTGYSLTGHSLGTIAAVQQNGSLVIQRQADSRVVDTDNLQALVERIGPGITDQPNSSQIVTRDPMPAERVAPDWKPGHEVVLVEEYVNGRWSLTDVQRLFRPIDEARVVERRDDVIVTDAQRLRVTRESVNREPGGGLNPVSPSSFEVGALVEGMGFLEPDGKGLAVVHMRTTTTG